MTQGPFPVGKMERNSFMESGSPEELACLGLHFSFPALYLREVGSEASKKKKKKKIPKQGGASTPWRNKVCGYWDYGLAAQLDQTRLDQIDRTFQFYIKESKRHPKVASRSVISKRKSEHSETVSSNSHSL